MNSLNDLKDWVYAQRTPESLVILADHYEVEGDLYVAENLRVASRVLVLLQKLKKRFKPPHPFVMDWVNIPGGGISGTLTRERVVECVTFRGIDVIGRFVFNLPSNWEPFDVVVEWLALDVPEQYARIL